MGSPLAGPRRSARKPFADIPARVLMVDVETGRRQVVLEIHPRDSSGVYSIEDVALTPDGAAYAYDDQQFQSDLYVVTGLRGFAIHRSTMYITSMDCAPRSPFARRTGP